jgi:hypothetical protein
MKNITETKSLKVRLGKALLKKDVIILDKKNIIDETRQYLNTLSVYNVGEMITNNITNILKNMEVVSINEKFKLLSELTFKMFDIAKKIILSDEEIISLVEASYHNDVIIFYEFDLYNPSMRYSIINFIIDNNERYKGVKIILALDTDLNLSEEVEMLLSNRCLIETVK